MGEQQDPPTSEPLPGTRPDRAATPRTLYEPSTEHDACGVGFVADIEGRASHEIVLDALPVPKLKPTKAKAALALSEFQPLSRDFAFVVGRDVPAGDIVKAAQNAERKLVTGVDVFDLYEGPGVPDGAKSVAIEIGRAHV